LSKHDLTPLFERNAGQISGLEIMRPAAGLLCDQKVPEVDSWRDGAALSQRARR